MNLPLRPEIRRVMDEACSVIFWHAKDSLGKDAKLVFTTLLPETTTPVFSVQDSRPGTGPMGVLRADGTKRCGCDISEMKRLCVFIWFRKHFKFEPERCFIGATSWGLLVCGRIMPKNGGGGRPAGNRRRAKL